MKRIAILTSALALGAFALGPFGLGRQAQDPVAHAAPVLDDPSAIADVADKVMPSVVTVSSTMARSRTTGGWQELHRGADGSPRVGTSMGSGVIVSAKGLVLTNNHVVANARTIRVSTSDGHEYAAELVGSDPKSDLAVLQLKGKLGTLVALPFGDSTRLRLGDLVLAVGNPFGVGQTLTMGIVSAKGRAMGLVDYEDFIQTDAAINQGNSGGPLVNLRGELVGINTAILSPSGGSNGIGFAIPSDMAQPIMQMLIDKGKVTRGWLGVSIQDVDQEMAETLELATHRGVLITDVVEQSPAARAGLARGDVVTSVAGKPTDAAAVLRNVVASLGTGRSVPLEFVRGKARKTAEVALTEQPERQSTSGGDRGEAARTDRLGIQVVPVSPSAQRTYDLPRDLDQGVVVTEVTRGSMAEGLGLRAGDVILEINRVAVKSARDLESEYRKAPRRLAVLVYRDGSTAYLMIQK